MAEQNASRTDDDESPSKRSFLGAGALIGRRKYLAFAGSMVAGAGLASRGAAAASTSNTLEILTESGTDLYYDFTATGEIQRVTDAGPLSAEKYNDKISQNADGTWSASGRTGGGEGDTYTVNGVVTTFSPADQQANGFSLRWNGQDVSTAELTGTTADVLEIRTESGTDLYYDFTADGKIIKDLDNGPLSAEKGNDKISQNADGTWTASGRTGGGEGDTYYLWGDATAFSPADQDANGFSLYLNGQAVSTAELTGQTSGSSGGTTTHTLEILTESGTDLYYDFTATGQIQTVTDNGSLSAEPNYNDTVTQNDDGTWSASGRTGGGEGDTYTFQGSVTDFSPMDESANGFSLKLDGQAITTYDLTGQSAPTHTLEILTESSTDLYYDFTATGQIQTVTDNGSLSAEPNYNDTVTQNSDGTWTASGRTGGGEGDTYTFQGSVTDFSPMDESTNGFSLTLDGESVTTYDLTGQSPPDGTTTNDSGPSGSQIGGGDGYANAVPESDADVVVRTKSDLANALSNASSGDVVYVGGGASIDLGGSTFQIPSGVTLASDRGINGAPGGHLYTNEYNLTSFMLSGDVRVTGLRMQGPFFEYLAPDSGYYGQAMELHGGGIEIDNCELWGFAYATMVSYEGDPHIHHNTIHHTPKDGSGYGMDILHGHPLVEYNYFNYNRHAVAASGDSDCSYTIRYNHVGPDIIDHVIDMHRDGGDVLDVHHNTIEPTTQVQNDALPSGVLVRGVPNTGATIYNNWFYNPEPPLSSPTNSWSQDQAIVQMWTDSWQNVSFHDNHYGSDDPGSGIGAPR